MLWLSIDIINTRNHFQLSLYLYRVINDAKGPIPAQTDKSHKPTEIFHHDNVSISSMIDQVLCLPRFNFRDGRFLIGDEIINVNGASLRGVTMEEARHILGTCGPEIDIIVAREHQVASRQSSGGGASNNAERRKRRKLPQIERPASAPVYKNVVTERTIMSTGDITKTVIMIGEEEKENVGEKTEPEERAVRSVSVQRRPSRNDHNRDTRVSKSVDRFLDR